MSSNQHRSGHARDMNQHFDSLAQAKDREERTSQASAAEDSPEGRPSRETPQTVFTGEHRMPLRDRLRAMRSGSSSRKGDTSAPAPATPSRARPPPLSLGAPRKSRKYLDLPISKSGTDSEDLLFKRSPTEQAQSGRRCSDVANERQRLGITTPEAPSPLRASFSAEEMMELTVQIDAAREEEEGEDRVKPETQTESLAERFERRSRRE